MHESVERSLDKNYEEYLDFQIVCVCTRGGLISRWARGSENGCVPSPIVMEISC